MLESNPLPDMTSLSVQEVTSSGEERASPEEAPVRVSLAGGGAYAQRGRLGYPDFVYSHAAQIFHTYHVEKPLSNRVIHYSSIPHTEDPPPENCSSESTTLWAFQMAFSTLTFQELLEDVLINSCFYSSQQTPDDLMPLAVVMLYDLQDRKFQPREPMTVEGEEPVEEVRRVESSLFSFRRKLEAELARFRIKHNLLSIHHFLPHNLRLKHLRTHTLPLYTWVNTLQISVEGVVEKLRDVGLVEVEAGSDWLDGGMFCRDQLCSDGLMLPMEAKEHLDQTSLLSNRSLIIQGRSRGLVASVVRPLVVEGSDVLMVGCFSAETVAHVAVHANANNTRVHVCGRIAKPNHREALQSVLTAVGCNNVQILSERFCDVTEWDSRVQKVRVVLLVPRCSVSGLCRPVQHILSEGGDLELIRDLSQGSVSLSRLNSLITEQIQDLRHALTFSKVNSVVYCTCSVYEEENELLVKRALESAPVRPKQRPFRIVSTGLGGDGEEKFFRMEESESDDGCFICLLKRDEETAKAETVQDILARAAAKGLLGGLMELQPPDQIKLKKKRKAADPPPPLSLRQPDASDTSRPPADDEELPPALRVSVKNKNLTLNLALNLNAEDFRSSSPSSIVPDQLYSALDQIYALSDQESEDSNATTPETNEQEREAKPQRRTRRNKSKSKSKSRSRTTNSHRSPASRKKKKKLHKPQIHRTHQTPAAPAHLPLPPPPPGTGPADLELQKLLRRRRAQRETPQEVIGSKHGALELRGRIKVKQEVVRSVGVVLPPISAGSRGWRVLSSGLSSELLQSSSSSSSSTGSPLPTRLLLSTGRTASRDSVQSASRTYR